MKEASWPGGKEGFNKREEGRFYRPEYYYLEKGQVGMKKRGKGKRLPPSISRRWRSEEGENEEGLYENCQQRFENA